ncbi:hypothetical protein ELE36_07265 [Pseudolysobacter antarcticus]|uniref:Uncharacterized protein n=2 Tax=Pseudolysobacter antarcticus TaxID=2511995 RepID=A0A411HIE9_9GAMM|nr:hypothetical protein ELE36_07265 [Pseudolysobacter antarcticus]
MASLFLAPDLAAFADTLPILQLRYSADTGANIVAVGQYASRQDYVSDNLAGSRMRVQIPGLPERSNLADFQVDTNGDVLFALDIGVSLGGTYFYPADVIKYSGGTFSKAFDAVAAGVPKGVHCDGVARLDTNSKLLLSFDRTFAANGFTVRPADVMLITAGAFSAKKLDAQALGFSSALNIVGIDAMGTHTDLLVAFDSAGTVGGVTFTRNDLLSVHLPSGVWTKRYALSSFSDRWNTAHVDGVAALNDTLFKDGFE